MKIDLTKTPRHGLRLAVPKGLTMALKEGRRVYFHGAPRQKIGSAISHLRLTGWPLRDEWVGDVDPKEIVTIDLTGGKARVSKSVKPSMKAKVYGLGPATMRYFNRQGAGTERRIGFGRWKVLEALGLVKKQA